MIVGTGNVGASIAYALINQNTPVSELILTDINEKDAEGEVMDLRDTLAVAPTYMKIRSGTYRDASSCDIVIITAGIPQRPGEPRLELLRKNAGVIKSIVKPIVKSGFNGIFLVVSNPMDVLTYLVWKYSGFSSSHVIGSGTVLDSARLRYRIGQELNVNPKSVHAYIIGEHGDTEFAVWSHADIGGMSVTKCLSEKARCDIEFSVRNAAYEIIDRKGATYYGIGACVANIVKCILGDERRILPVSSYDDYADVYNGFPAVIGRRGVFRRLDISLTESEAIAIQKSNNTLAEAIKSVK